MEKRKFEKLGIETSLLGRLVFLFLEVLRGKPIPPEKEGVIHFAGFVALMVLMVFVMFNDIQRIIG